MSFNSKEHLLNGKYYYFSAGDLYEKRNKTWYCVDHVYEENYKKIADEIKSKEQQK